MSTPFKMKGPSLYPKFLKKKQRGPVETKNKPSRKEIEDSFKIGETIEKLQDDAMKSPGAYIKNKMKKK